MKTPEIPDPDLTTPVHDEIMIWLDNMFRAAPVSAVKAEVRYATREDDCKFVQLDSRAELIEWLDRKGTSAKLVQQEEIAKKDESHRIDWEYPVPQKNVTIGYVDLYVRIRQIKLKYYQVMHKEYCGTPDCRHGECWEVKLDRSYYQHYAFEVKSTIPSLGELLRQIRKYETALPWCHCPYKYGEQDHRYSGEDEHFIPKFVVVSPDTRKVEKITQQETRTGLLDPERQPIGFIEYPSGKAVKFP
jgi:hypothetical protein